MNVRQRRRGRPLIALVVVLGTWTGLRAWLWEAALLLPTALAGPAPLALADGAEANSLPRGGPSAAVEPLPGVRGGRLQPYFGAQTPRKAGKRAATASFVPGRSLFPASPYSSEGAPLPGLSPVELIRRTSDAAPFQPPVHDTGRRRRWSADGWLLLRDDGSAILANGVAPATYGASQAGAVLRYRLASESGHRPTAYLRATAALNGSDESEGALGLSARPVPAIPVIVTAEMRLMSHPYGTRARPAIMAITELAPLALPLKAQGETYVQAGYVGGRYATPFIDGQLRIDRPVAAIGRAELRAGGGAWGGAQKGASRLDLGPAATLAMGLGGGASARLAVDWRFRVAGNAEPDSGPALTLSAGF